MQEEYNSLMANNTWELTMLPKGRKNVGCKWMFRTKKDALGKIVRYKTRLVANRYSQVAELDFNETLAPVAQFITIRCNLTLGSAMDWEIHKMNVKTVFLNGIFKVEIYMGQPEGFVQEGQEDLVCKFKKALYMLKQSMRVWYHRIDLFFVEEKYFSQTSQYLLVTILYVDNLIILASNITQLKWLKLEFEKEYEMSDLRELLYFLEVQKHVSSP